MPVFVPVALSLMSLVGTPSDLPPARTVELIGFGLVVGLDGTGSHSMFTQQVTVDMLQRLGVARGRMREIADGRINDRLGPCRRPRVTTAESVMRSGNCSAVLVTARLGSGASKGERVDVTVSSMDDARSLRGGQLLLTSLKGVDGEVYAVAQGQMSVSRQTAGAEKSQLNTGSVPKGAMVERSVK